MQCNKILIMFMPQQYWTTKSMITYVCGVQGSTCPFSASAIFGVLWCMHENYGSDCECKCEEGWE